MTANILPSLHVIQLGCGVAGDMFSEIITSLGGEVTKVRRSPCPACGDLCDDGIGWRAFFDRNVNVVEVTGVLDKQQILTLLQTTCRTGVVIDGLPSEIVDSVLPVVTEYGVPSVVLSAGTNTTVELHGLIAEAQAGIAGSMGRTSGEPMPFGFLFGEANAAIRGVCLLLAALLDGEPGARMLDGAAACIDAMDNPWQEMSLPGPAHSSPNSLTRRDFQRTGAQKAGLVPYGLFEANDRWLGLVAAGTTGLLAERMERPDLMDDARFNSVDGRVANREYIVDLVSKWIRTFPTANDFVEFMGNNTVVAPMLTLAEALQANPELLGRDSPTAPYTVYRPHRGTPDLE